MKPSFLRILICVVVSSTFVHGSFAQIARQNWWVPDGPIYDVVPDPVSGQVYIGGKFTRLGPSVPFGAIIDDGTAQVLPDCVHPNGEVLACVADGSGGWYIGGHFSHVGGQPRNHVARINADGTLHAWDPNVSTNYDFDIPYVNCLLLVDNVVFVGGNFDQVAGQARGSLAAVDATSGSALPFNGQIVGILEEPNALVAADGILYVGGYFTNAGGAPRTNLAAFDIASGSLTPFNVPVYGGSFGQDSYPIQAMLIHDGRLFIGGRFWEVDGVDREQLASISLLTGELEAWFPSVGSGSVYALCRIGTTIYVGGNFEEISGIENNYLAAVDATTGSVLPWNPNISGFSTTTFFHATRVYALASDGNDLIVAGDFRSVNNGTLRDHLARIDALTGVATAWSPRMNREVRCLALGNGTVYAGGYFTSAGQVSVERTRLAAMDPATGMPTDWAPLIGGGTVASILVKDDRVYAGGQLFGLGSGPFDNLAAFDRTSGTRLPWYPNIGLVNCLVDNGDNLFVGGAFTTVGTAPRVGIAQLDISTATATAWNANITSQYVTVEAALVKDGMLYITGDFNSINGETRDYLAALNTATAALNPWNPAANDEVRELTSSADLIYVAGNFNEIGGAERETVAALDPISAAVSDWQQNSSGPVGIQALHYASGVVYAGGVIQSYGGLQHSNLAALDASTNSALPWTPAAMGIVNRIASNDSLVFVAGDGGLDMYGIAYFGAFSKVYSPNAIPEVVVPTVEVHPNPTNGVIISDWVANTANIKIRNVTGEVVLETKAYHQLDLGHLPSGMYLLECLSKEGQILSHVKVVRD